MNINEKLQKALNIKNGIKSSLENKGIDMSDKKFEDYPAIIEGINPGPIEKFSGTKVYKNFIEAEELEYMNVRGALLWTKNGASEGTDGYLLASNGDSEEPGYWDPNAIDMNQPEKAGYTLIAACLGNGYWGRVGYTGLTTTKKWCQSGDNAYSFLSGACYHSGYEITKFMTGDNHPTYSTESIWGLRDADGLNAHIYIPNWAELVQVCNLACDGGSHSSGHTYNKNLGKLFGLLRNNYWSASQCPDQANSNYAYCVDVGDGRAFGNNKSYYSISSFALLHFGA